MTDSLRWGVLAPTFDPFGTGTPPLLAAAKLAEELAFDTLWVGDHLLWPVPALDSLCALSAVGAVTSGIGIGVSVLQLGLRHLVWTAKQLATIDAIAPGRLRLGVGVGGEFPEEFEAAGVSLAGRGRRLDEMLDLLPALLCGAPVDYEGEQLRVHVKGLRPAVSRLPRVAIGGRSEAALRRAARYGDEWMGMWHSADTVRERAGRLAALAEGEGRRAPDVAMLVLVNVNDDARAARSEVAATVRGQYGLPIEAVERWTPYGPPEEVAKMVVDYRDAGVSELLLLPAAEDALVQFERLAAVRQLVEG